MQIEGIGWQGGGHQNKVLIIVHIGRWVLTVPALWNEEHKLFMRKAAVEAGIVESTNSSNLLLCLEPEGASI